ncbi:glycoside hydrolase family 55 protein [Bipolaris oryzae ATCC 44560]|uniref:Glycoside hydrolase family 55 protein n=1 Tax=Bipolaris oryzae ATCC 44560 TaxID=930090 RepID=W6ZZ26_COCMI|nr:glycoside hydrolase family 55 protein [Bipolaris oryzae ATCC 44560]EUC49001.1 glycoside hydrolase family 55 protein [Bipolaris oryzae ATCC 44560]
MFNPTAVVLGLLSTSALALNARYAHQPADISAPAEPFAHPHVKPRQHLTSGSNCAPYWMENIKHQGIASFNPNPNNYTVFRNVKSYGAVGDGVTDDTAAINRAITDGNRCVPGNCSSSTNTPAILYFPGGTYLVSDAIKDYYNTQIVGNPNCLPTILAAANFSSPGGTTILDGSGYGSTVSFYRQIRNIIIDTTRLPTNFSAVSIYWPTAQATSIQNVVFNMNPNNGTTHIGLLIDSGSGGFMTDLVFNGGRRGFLVGNQQFTTRNLTFNNIDTAIEMFWDWGWTYKSVSINNCRVGLNVSSGGSSSQSIGSITLFDSEIKNTEVGIATARTDNSQPAAAGALYLENVKFDNVQAAVLGSNGTYLAGSSGSVVVDAWADGHRYTSYGGPDIARGRIEPTQRPADLVDAQGRFYERSKPSYGDVPLSQFLSARDLGATGNGRTDDTAALNAAILRAKEEGKILFLDAGYYKVTSTIYVPPGSIIVGEPITAVILSSGPFFNSMADPQPVVRIALPGETGRVEISDLIVSTQGQQAGAILYEYNLGTYNQEPAGLWDVHARIGGFAGSELQTAQCERTPSNVTITEGNLDQDCIASYMTMHVTKFGAGLYMENNWLWTADHELDTRGEAQLTLYAGRGLLVESINGRLWLYGTSVEHHTLYQYQFVDTRNIFMGQIQTETAYYQPNPNATIPFPVNPSLFDPVFSSSEDPSAPPSTLIPLFDTPSNATSRSSNSTTVPSPNTVSGWGLRIIRSNNILGYGIGLYSFFNNYSTNCSRVDALTACQQRILSIEGATSTYDVSFYNLNTVGSTQMITRDGVQVAGAAENNSTFVDTVNVFRIDGFGA